MKNGATMIATTGAVNAGAMSTLADAMGMALAGAIAANDKRVPFFSVPEC